jgi:hypothetical protein
MSGLAIASSGFARASTPAQNFRVGNRFSLAASARLIGVRVAHKLASEGTPETLSLDAHDSNGTLLESVSSVFSASGAQAVYFVSSYTIAANTLFTLSAYGVTNNYSKWTMAGLTVKAPDFVTAYATACGVYLGGGVTFLDGYYKSSDAYPDTRNAIANTSSQMFGIDPILDIDG